MRMAMASTVIWRRLRCRACIDPDGGVDVQHVADDQRHGGVAGQAEQRHQRPRRASQPVDHPEALQDQRDAVGGHHHPGELPERHADPHAGPPQVASEGVRRGVSAARHRGAMLARAPQPGQAPARAGGVRTPAERPADVTRAPES